MPPAVALAVIVGGVVSITNVPVALPSHPARSRPVAVMVAIPSRLVCTVYVYVQVMTLFTPYGAATGDWPGAAMPGGAQSTKLVAKTCPCCVTVTVGAVPRPEVWS